MRTMMTLEQTIRTDLANVIDQIKKMEETKGRGFTEHQSDIYNVLCDKRQLLTKYAAMMSPEKEIIEDFCSRNGI